jgi:hypothetical protein
MADPRLVQLGLKLPDGSVKNLSAGREADGTYSLQVFDLEQRAILHDLKANFTGTIAGLAAAATALEDAATAEEASTAVILANVTSLINAAAQVSAASTTLLGVVNTEIGALTATQALIQQMAVAMQVSFGGLDDVRSIVQGMVNNITTLLASHVPLPFPLDPIGHPVYATAHAVPQGLETLLVDLLVPVAMTYVLAGFTATGTSDALYRLYLEAAPLLGGRSSAADRTVNGLFPASSKPRGGPNQRIRVTVYHSMPLAQDFEGTLHGYFT